MSQRRNQKEIKKNLETKENGNTAYQNLRDSAKAVLRGTFIALNASIKKKSSNKQSSFTSHRTR